MLFLGNCVVDGGLVCLDLMVLRDILGLKERTFVSKEKEGERGGGLGIVEECGA